MYEYAHIKPIVVLQSEVDVDHICGTSTEYHHCVETYARQLPNVRVEEY